MELELTKRQKAIVVGSVLGDGYLEFKGFNGTRLQVKQSERYKKYVHWLYCELKNVCKSPPNQKKDSKQWYFGTRYIDELTELRKIFYDERGIKIVPDNIKDILLDPLSLAVWYMDDGTLDWRPKNHYAFCLNTHCFSLKGVNKLVETLVINFDVKAAVYNNLIRGKRYPRIIIGQKGRDRFLTLIKPYIINCFNYKLPPL